MAWSTWLGVLFYTITIQAQGPDIPTIISDDTGSCPVGQAAACLPQDSNVAVFPASGTPGKEELYIGGIFPVHDRGAEPFTCGWVNVDSFQEMMAFQWAVSTSSKRLAGLVSARDKGTVIFDSCGTDYSATQSIFGLEKCKSRPNRFVASTTPSSNNNVTTPIHFVDRRSIAGYINGLDSRNGQREDEAGQIMGGLRKPVINTGTYSSDFSSKQSGARFNFVAPTIRQQIEATVAVIASTVSSSEVFVMVLYSDDEFSMDAFNEFKMATSARNICVVYESKIESPLQESQLEDTARDLLVNKDSRFVVSLLPERKLRQLYRRVLDKTNNIFNLTFVFPPFAEKNAKVLLDSSVVAFGAVQLRHQSGRWLSEFEEFYHQMVPQNFPTVPLVAEFWQQRFQCNLIGRNGNAALRFRDFCDNSKLSLRGDDITTRTGYVISAVDALLVAVEEVEKQNCSLKDLCLDKFDEVIPKSTSAGRKLFNPETGGPASWEFDVFNLRDNSLFVQVGPIKEGEIDKFPGSKIVAYERQNKLGTDKLEPVKPQSLCPTRQCQKCRDAPPPVTTTPIPNTTQPDDTDRILDSYAPLRTHSVSRTAYVTGMFFRQRRPDSNYTSRLYASNYTSVWSIALAALAGLGIIAVILLEICLIYLIVTYKFEGPEGKRTSHLNFRSLWLGQLLLFGIFLSYLTLFAYLPVPTKVTCGITRFGIGISYAIIFSGLLVKLMVILHSRTTSNFIPGEVNPSFQQSILYMVSLFLMAFCVQLIIAVHWLIQVPPEAVLVRDNSGELVWICNHYTWSLKDGFWDMSMFVRTEFENHLLSLIYIMFLILVTFFLSLKAFDIVSNMRESRFIALASGVSILIFIAWAMIGGFLKDHVKSHEIGDGCIGFGLFFTSTIILFFLFLPKVRQLVVIGMEGVFLEDDKETTYASSIYSPASVISPGGHRSMSGYAEGSVIGMHPMDRSVHVMHDTSVMDDFSRPIINVDTSFMSADPPLIYDPHALSLKHPRSSGPSLYSVRSTPNLYDPPELYRNRSVKLTRNLTGKGYMNETFSGSEYPSLYRPKSEILLYRHPRSEIGSL